MRNHNGGTSVKEFEKLAEEKLKKEKKLRLLWNYINVTSGDGQTYVDSLASFKRFRLQPRILSARPERSTWTSLLGNPVRLPVGISPVVGYTFLHLDGAAGAGRATAKAGTLMILSSVENISLEDFNSMIPSNGLYWAQTYLFRDKRNTLSLVKNAERLGFKAVVVTVDSPVESRDYGQRKGNLNEYFKGEAKKPCPNIKYLNGKKRVFKEIPSDDAVLAIDDFFAETAFCADWKDLAWLQDQTRLPIVLKGVLTAESARLAAQRGISGIIVSAHGGRQLDGVPAPLDALPDIVDAVKDTNVEVYLDGGIRTGSDVIKALALGARAVFIGRPALWGAAVAGEDGVYNVLQILENELKAVLALCGCSSLKEVNRSIIKHESEFHSKL